MRSWHSTTSSWVSGNKHLFLFYRFLFLSFPLSAQILIFFFLVFIFSYLHSALSDKVVGEKEKASNTVNVRTRDNKVHGECSVEECIKRLTELKASRSRNAEEEFWAQTTSLHKTSIKFRCCVYDQLFKRGMGNKCLQMSLFLSETRFSCTGAKI